MTSTDTPALAPKGKRFFTRPVLIAGVIGWISLNVAALILAGGYLPFDRPALAGMPFAVQMAIPTVGMIQIFLMMGLV